MNLVGLVIIAVALAISITIGVLSHGHVIFFALPLVLGLPLAGLLGRRR